MPTPKTSPPNASGPRRSSSRTEYAGHSTSSPAGPWAGPGKPSTPSRGRRSPASHRHRPLNPATGLTSRTALCGAPQDRVGACPTNGPPAGVQRPRAAHGQALTRNVPEASPDTARDNSPQAIALHVRAPDCAPAHPHPLPPRAPSPWTATPPSACTVDAPPLPHCGPGPATGWPRSLTFTRPGPGPGLACAPCT